ncbi:MAG: hypothetical protein RMM29_01920 [Planctomycetota bacterium]|nr:hypothetical protein [Planctomycetota bacterium]MCX8040311.1 hypothetical protein [Planctomycetota bacterium]MDW8372394.1 hypothetical protein [Planctomycetota bacterium]
MPRCALLLALAASVPAAQGLPFFVQAGGDYLGPELRKALETDWGYRLGLGTLLLERGLVGLPTIDLDGRYAPDGEGTFAAFEVTYAERRQIRQRWWLGLGLGSNFVRLKLAEIPGVRAAAEQRRWDIGGKLMAGYLLSERLFFEITWHYTRRALDLETMSFSGGLGYWF